MNRVTSAVVALTFLPLSQGLGAAPVFAVYAILGAAATAFYHATLPDTLGKSLEAIATSATSHANADSQDDHTSHLHAPGPDPVC